MSVLAAIWVRYPGLQHGDSFSDANVLNASRNFEAAGFAALWGLPYHRATWSPDRPGAPTPTTVPRRSGFTSCCGGAYCANCLSSGPHHCF